MCNYNFLGLFEDKLDEILLDFCRYKSGIEDPDAEVPMFIQVKKIEDYLNTTLTDKTVWSKIYTDYEALEDFGMYKSLPQSFGKLNEEFLYRALEAEFPGAIEPFPNGEMNFPDVTFYDMPMDFKAVKCEMSGKSIKVKYSNAIDSVYEVSKVLFDYFYLDKDCDLADSFLIFTFYDEYEELGKVRFLHFKIMPTIYCIQLTRDGRFSLKSNGEQDEDGNYYKIKNSNVNIKIPTVDRTDEDTLKLPSIEEKLLMVRNAVDKEKWEESMKSIRWKHQQEIEAYGYPGQ
jgi:hypothetical protein